MTQRTDRRTLPEGHQPMMDLQNKGLISFHDSQARGIGASGTRTLIVSGVARSGTSMIARVLHGAGVFMGENMDQIVFEDHAFALAFENGGFDAKVVARLRRARDARHPVWGFKRPHLHVQGSVAVTAFRNPRVILTVRDPVAIAERNAIAEQRDPANGLAAAMEDLQAMLHFAQALTCPVLLVSYEKAVRQPARFISRLLDFCGIEMEQAEQRGLVALVEPDRPAYLQSARRRFDGYIDEIRDNTLTGWACQRDVPLPVTVTVFRDDVAVADCRADRLRQDLLQSGIGSGEHGFSVNLKGLGFKNDSRVTVRIEGRSFELQKSGSTVAALRS